MTVLKHHNNVTTNWYMRKIVAMGFEGGGGCKSVALSFMTMLQHLYSHIAHCMRYNRRKCKHVIGCHRLAHCHRVLNISVAANELTMQH